MSIEKHPVRLIAITLHLDVSLGDFDRADRSILERCPTSS